MFYENHFADIDGTGIKIEFIIWSFYDSVCIFFLKKPILVCHVPGYQDVFFIFFFVK